MARSQHATELHEIESTEAESQFWSQPAVYIPVATDKRGHFQRLPEFAVLAVIAENFGAKTAEIWFDAMRQFALRVAQAAAKGKTVADSLTAEQAASAAALTKLANGSYEGRDTNPNNAFESWIESRIREKAGADKATRKNVLATMAAHGDELAAIASYVPSKRAAKAAEDTSSGEALDLA